MTQVSLEPVLQPRHGTGDLQNTPGIASPFLAAGHCLLFVFRVFNQKKGLVVKVSCARLLLYLITCTNITFVVRAICVAQVQLTFVRDRYEAVVLLQGLRGV